MKFVELDFSLLTILQCVELILAFDIFTFDDIIIFNIWLLCELK